MINFILGFISAFVLIVLALVAWALWEKRQERLDQDYAERFQKREVLRRMETTREANGIQRKS